MIEIPPRFNGKGAVHLDSDSGQRTWKGAQGTWTGAQGLAADVGAYGKWLEEQALNRIGQHYPDATGPRGETLKPIAWIWARTVESPDPAWNGHVPLVGSWLLANKTGKPKVWIEPVVDHGSQTIRYEIRVGGTPSREPSVSKGIGTCIATGAAIPNEWIKQAGVAGELGQRLLAVVAQGKEGGKVYCQAQSGDVAAAAASAVGAPEWRPEGTILHKHRDLGTSKYGMDEWWKLFTPRQLIALTTFSDLLGELGDRVRADAAAAGFDPDGGALCDGGAGAAAYAEAIVTYLAFAVDKCADYWATTCPWHRTHEKMRQTFAMQSLNMSWDFAEANPFSGKTGSWGSMVGWSSKAVAHLPDAGSVGADSVGCCCGQVLQRDARQRLAEAPESAVSTDPPYYDNICYADISDYFFVWLRRNLSDVWPDECATLTTPKADELVANRYRAGSKQAANSHFESGMADFMAQLAKTQHPSVPATVYYAYKATEQKKGAVRSPGWDTFLQATVDAGFQITATWPLRTESVNKLVARGKNALTSSIVLALRRRPDTAAPASTEDFLTALRRQLPDAVRVLQSGNIAPVDMAQSTIGPGISIFSGYAKVLAADGSAMSVSDALVQVNAVLGEILDGEATDLDPYTRFAVSWFSLCGYNPGPSGDADSQARAKGTTLDGVEEAGIAISKQGRFRLLERTELAPDWTPPQTDDRLIVWEATQYLVKALHASESEAARLLVELGGYGDQARSLAYLLFSKATEQGWASEAAAYDGLVTAWPALTEIGARPDAGQQQLKELD